MNLIEASPLWLVWALIAAITAAAIEDVLRLRISNITCAILALGAVGAMIAVGPTFALWQNVTLFALILVLGTGAFAAGLFGGGDVKLLAAASLWLDLKSGAVFLVAVVLAGGGVAALSIAGGLMGIGGGAVRPLRSRRVPYGVAIALGTLITVALAREHPLNAGIPLSPVHR